MYNSMSYVNYSTFISKIQQACVIRAVGEKQVCVSLVNMFLKHYMAHVPNILFMCGLMFHKNQETVNRGKTEVIPFHLTG